MRAILFLITLYVFESSGQPCEDKNSIDISNGNVFGDGTIVKDGVTFPPKYVYSKNVSGEIRSFGCVCAVKNCLRKCCALGSVMFRKNCTEMPNMDVLLKEGAKVYFKNAFQQQIKLDSNGDLFVIHGRPCKRVYLEDEPWFVQEYKYGLFWIFVQNNRKSKVVIFTMLLFITIPFALFLLYLYLNGKYNERYWKKRGVLFHPENKTGGVYWEFLTQDISLFEALGKLYRKYSNEPAVGVGLPFRPAILMRDINNINYILQTDFESFSWGGMDTPEADKLSRSVLFMNGKEWKLMRQSMSPLFTASKLKNMFYIMEKSAKDYINLLDKPGALDGDTYDSLAGYVCASIAASVFGIHTESVFDSPFLSISREALKPSFILNLKFTMNVITPRLYKLLKVKLFPGYEDRFIGALSHVIRERHQDGTKRHDFVDLCVTLQNNGTLRDAETKFELEPTDELLAAQAFFYFTAGVEPCTSTIFATLMELGRNPEIMQRVHEEIDNVFNETKGKLSYDSVMNMEYLEKVINETLRLYAPAGFGERRCVKDATLPVGNIRIERGTHIFIPIYEIHHDPKYFPDPYVFNPDRFDGNENNNVFLPFSKGNRFCIGARFARLQVKTGLVYVLRHYTPSTTVLGPEIKFKKQPFQVHIENVRIKLMPREVQRY